MENEMSQLESNFSSISGACETLNNSFTTRRSQLEKLNGAKKNLTKLQFITELPARLQRFEGQRSPSKLRHDELLPSPLGVRPLLLSTTNVGRINSFARSGALSSRPQELGTVTQASVIMDGGADKVMLGDARVALASSDSSCIEVAADLASAGSYAFRALAGGSCTQATITATFTLGSWVDSASATVYIVRPQFMAAGAALYPPCASAATTLYTMGCAVPAVRQRVRFSASYALESDDAGYAQSGSINLAHSDVGITRTNLAIVSGVDIHTGSSAGTATYAISLKGQSASIDVTISDSALAQSSITPSVDETLVSTKMVGVQATFSGFGVSCTYSDSHISTKASREGYSAWGITSTGSGKAPSLVTNLLSSAMQTNSLAALATIFSRVRAAPPPLIMFPRASISSAPST